MKEIEKAQMGIIAVLALMLVSIKRRLPEARRLSSGITTLALAGIVLLVAAGGASANGACIGANYVFGPGDTVNESCTFNASMDCTDETLNGLIIGADNIVIDGAGYKITGNESNCLCYNGGLTDEQSPAPHCGIRNDGNYDNVVIKNLEIENFCTGIAWGDPTHISVDNNTVTGCYIHHNGNDTECGSGGDVVTHGIHIVAANNCTITKNEITYNDGTGDQCGGGGNGIFMFGRTNARGNYNNFTCNNLSYNAKSGFFMKKMCMYNIINGNKATNNGEGGIVPMCKMSNYNYIEYNNMSNNAKWGYYTAGTYNIIRYNTANNNGQEGFYIGAAGGGDGKYNNITNNSACGNSNKDIRANSANNIANSNTCDTSDLGGCDWSCGTDNANLVSVYFDYDDDDQYSKAACSCSIVGGGGYPCCNPGLFNGSTDAETSYRATCDCQFQTPGPDPNDQDVTIQGDTKPDLIVANKSEAWVTETTYNVNYRVQNIGNGTSSESVACVYIDTAHQAGSDQNIAALAPLEYSAVKTVGPFTMSDTSDTIKVCADCTGTNDEWDETNNCTENVLDANQPDLIITDKNETWMDQAAGIYRINHRVCNIGTADAPASTTRVFIDGGNSPPPGNVPALAKGECQWVQIGNHTMTGDSDTITLFADGNNSGNGVIDELNETNNSITNTFHKSDLTIYVDPSYLDVTPQHQFDVNITVDPAGLEIYGVEYYLTYNVSVLRAESQVKGPFLGTTSETIVVVNEIDRGAGIVSYAETRKDSDSGVNVTGISSVIQFTAIGAAGECTDLDLYGVIIVNTAGGQVTAIIEDGEVCLTNNQAPVAAGCTKHLHNNAQKKFECLAQLCSNSTDPDGDDIVYIRWSFGDGEYGTSEGLGVCPCKLHSYTSWIWEPFGDPTGGYVPFNASLTVTDNGDPQLENTTYFNVSVYLAGDANYDGTVNILDAVLIGLTWDEECTGTDCCELLWTDNEMADKADLNNDCKINILDAVIVGTMWDHNAYYPV